MKWYKENTFLVMSKDMKYKDSLETVGGLLEQAGLSYSKIRFYMQLSERIVILILSCFFSEKQSVQVPCTAPFLLRY